MFSLYNHGLFRLFKHIHDQVIREIVIPKPKSNDPLHGITLEMILTQLVQQYGWPELAKRIPIRCFYNEPSIKSSLKFLRRTPWARKSVEELFLKSIA
jgi:uncharacterized protein (DUF2132 family)